MVLQLEDAQAQRARGVSGTVAITPTALISAKAHFTNSDKFVTAAGRRA
jgi:hypothetical protein